MSDHPTEVPLDHLSLSKERRSGIGRRQNESDSEARFRSQVEREYRQELLRLRDENEEKSVEIERLHGRVSALELSFAQYQESHRETLRSAHSIVNAGMVFRSIILGIIAVTAMIGGLSATFEILKKVLRP